MTNISLPNSFFAFFLKCVFFSFFSQNGRKKFSLELFDASHDIYGLNLNLTTMRGCLFNDIYLLEIILSFSFDNINLIFFRNFLLKKSSSESSRGVCHCGGDIYFIQKKICTLKIFFAFKF